MCVTPAADSMRRAAHPSQVGLYVTMYGVSPHADMSCGSCTSGSNSSRKSRRSSIAVAPRCFASAISASAPARVFAVTLVQSRVPPLPALCSGAGGASECAGCAARGTAIGTPTAAQCGAALPALFGGCAAQTTPALARSAVGCTATQGTKHCFKTAVEAREQEPLVGRRGVCANGAAICPRPPPVQLTPCQVLMRLG